MERTAQVLSSMQEVFDALKATVMPLVRRFLAEDPGTELLAAQQTVLRSLAPAEAREAFARYVKELEAARSLSAVWSYALGREAAAREALEVPCSITRFVWQDMEAGLLPGVDFDARWSPEHREATGLIGHVSDWIDAVIAEAERVARRDATADELEELCPRELLQRIEDELYSGAEFPLRWRLCAAMYRAGREAWEEAGA